MDIWLIFQNSCMYALPDAFLSLFRAMDTFETGAEVTRKGHLISMQDPYRKPTQVGESSRLR